MTCNLHVYLVLPELVWAAEQAHERESEALVGDLQRASRSLAHVLHQQDTNLPNASPRYPLLLVAIPFWT